MVGTHQFMRKHRQYCCGFAQCDGSSFIYSSHKKRQTAKPVEEQNDSGWLSQQRDCMATPIMTTVL